MLFKHYKTEKGDLPVFDFIESLPRRDKIFVQAKINWAEDSTQLTRDFYTKFKGYRIDFGEFRIGNYRILVLRLDSQTFLLLHGFRKTTNETPENVKKIAYNRAIDYLRRNPFQ